MPAGLKPRFLCLLVEHLPTKLEILLHPKDLSKAPVVVLREWDEAVQDASPIAAAYGITPGDSRRRIEQLCNEAVILPARDAIYRSHHDSLHGAVSEFATAVEIGGLGEFYINITELARTFPTEKALALTLIAQTDQVTKLTPVVGIASSKFVAARAALEACSANSRVLVIPPGRERQFLNPLPLTALPRPPIELIRRLILFGITTLGQFAEVPSIAIREQFGSDMAVYHDMARGIDLRTLAPYSAPPSITRTIPFADPVESRSMLLKAFERGARRISQELKERGYQTTALSTIVLTTDGVEHSIGTSIKPPTAELEDLRRTVGRLVNQLQLKSAAICITLTAYPLQEWAKGFQQVGLFEAEAAAKRELLQPVIRRLQQRFGEAVLRLASTLGAPIPVAIKVTERSDGAPSMLSWGGLARMVIKVSDRYRERRRWWNIRQMSRRQYYQVECTSNLIFTVFQDHRGKWFLDRRRARR